MKPLKAAATTSQPVLTSQQIETIFFKVPELYEIHKEFYDGLSPRVQQWSHQQRVGDLFQKLVSGSEYVHGSHPGASSSNPCLSWRARAVRGSLDAKATVARKSRGVSCCFRCQGQVLSRRGLLPGPQRKTCPCLYCWVLSSSAQLCLRFADCRVASALEGPCGAGAASQESRIPI